MATGNTYGLENRKDAYSGRYFLADYPYQNTMTLRKRLVGIHDS
jgi:hypothetical protein